MTDMMTKKQRSENMKAIKSISRLESIVTRELWKEGFRFRRNRNDLFGRPDVSIKKYQVVIFIDSCFWHQCLLHSNMPKSNTDYWDKKLKRNVKRDLKVNNYYKEKGWNIKRVWEHEIKDNLDQAVKDLSVFIINAKQKQKKDPGGGVLD